MSYEDRIQAEVDSHNQVAEEIQTLTNKVSELQQDLLQRRGRIQLLQELAQEESAAQDNEAAE